MKSTAVTDNRRSKYISCTTMTVLMLKRFLVQYYCACTTVEKYQTLFHYCENYHIVYFQKEKVQLYILAKNVFHIVRLTVIDSMLMECDARKAVIVAMINNARAG